MSAAGSCAPSPTFPVPPAQRETSAAPVGLTAMARPEERSEPDV
jgi:hypothetical protein